MLETALIVLGLVVGVPYLLGPVLIKFIHAQSATPRFRTLDLSAEPAPPEAMAYFERELAGLTAAGFTPTVCMEMSGYTANVAACFTLFENRATNDLAMAVAFYQIVQDQRAFRSGYTEYLSRFEGERSLSTNNTGELLVTPRIPGRERQTFAMVQDAQRLYKAHAALAARQRAGPRLPPPQGPSLEALLLEGIARENEVCAQAGYLWFDATAGKYRPTWKGAFLMTWQLLFPAKNLLLAARDRRAAALLRELGV